MTKIKYFVKTGFQENKYTKEFQTCSVASLVEYLPTVRENLGSTPSIV